MVIYWHAVVSLSKKGISIFANNIFPLVLPLLHQFSKSLTVVLVLGIQGLIGLQITPFESVTPDCMGLCQIIFYSKTSSHQGVTQYM